jgi:hypothetical protein
MEAAVILVVLLVGLTVAGAVSSQTPVQLEEGPHGVRWRMFALNGFTREGEIDVPARRLRFRRKILGFIPAGSVDRPLSEFGRVTLKIEPWGDDNNSYRVEIARRGTYELTLVAFPEQITSTKGHEYCTRLRDAIERAQGRAMGR